MYIPTYIFLYLHSTIQSIRKFIIDKSCIDIHQTTILCCFHDVGAGERSRGSAPAKAERSQKCSDLFFFGCWGVGAVLMILFDQFWIPFGWDDDRMMMAMEKQKKGMDTKSWSFFLQSTPCFNFGDAVSPKLG